jgi:hypothetical protein
VKQQLAKDQPSPATSSPRAEVVNEAEKPAAYQPPVKESPVEAERNRAERRRMQRERNHIFGGPLLESDFAALERCAILRRDAEKMCGRVDSVVGSEMFGQSSIRNYAGVVFRIMWPGNADVREYLLRRDDPEVDANGRPQRKYLWPPGRGNILLFPPDAQREWLDDVSLPIVFCEGPKKLLALWNLAWFKLTESAEVPRFLPVAVSGVWNFYGRNGKHENARGEKVDQKGLLSDFARIAFKGREATIWYDRNVHDNREKTGSVNHARNTFAKELRSLGARMFFCDLPADDLTINGPDDFAGKYGLDAALKAYEGRYDPKAKEQTKAASQPLRIDISQLCDVRTRAAERVEFLVHRVIVKDTITLITGPPGSGKTTVTLWMADAVAHGREILGGTCEQHPVLYMTREMPVALAADMARRFQIDNGPDTNLFMWGPWNDQLPPEPAATCILEWVSLCEVPPLIIVDPVIAFLPPGASENDSVEIRGFFEQGRTLLRAGAAGVIYLHHTGKSETSQDFRGSSDFRAAIDLGYKVTNSSDNLLDRLHVKLWRPRFGIERNEFVLRYSEINGRASFVSDERPAAVRESISDQLTKLLAANPGLTVKEFEKAAMAKGLTQASARRFLDIGVEAGKIIRERGTHNRMFHRLADGSEWIQ